MEKPTADTSTADEKPAQLQGEPSGIRPGATSLAACSLSCSWRNISPTPP